MPRRLCVMLLGATYLAACDQTPPEPQLRLPEGLVPAARDPYRAALFALEDLVLARGAALRGDIAATAEAAAWFEVLTNRMASLPEPDDATNRAPMREARAQLRQTLGFAPEAPGQAILDTLWAVATAARAERLDTVDLLLAAPVSAYRPADMRDRFERFQPSPGMIGALQRVSSSFRRQQR